MKTLDELFRTKRMDFGPLDDNNSVAGLYDMLKVANYDYFMAGNTIKVEKPKDFDGVIWYEPFPQFPLIVEVGSYAGVSSDLFARYCKQLVCVDIWNFKDGQGMGADIVETAWLQFNEMRKAHKNIDVIIDYSVKASKEFDDNSIDLVYIDAKHDYSEVLQDIKAWLPKVKQGGYISGHDIHMDGVRQAVVEMFGKNYKTYKDTSWITQK